MLYKIGHGPSSSHTMGPQYAAEYVNTNYPDATFVKVILYGSLALTGEGHGTDKVLKETDSSHLMEGLYIKIEENGIVTERLKYVR